MEEGSSSMSNVMTIFKKEMRTYFTSPIAYFVLTIFLVFCGIFFSMPLFLNNQASMRGAFSIILYAFTLFVPAITMRLISEEKKSGTFELLATMPISYAITVSLLGEVDAGEIFSGYVGLALLGSAYVAIGICASSLTENQIVAFLLSLAVILFLTFIDKLVSFLPIGGANIFEYLGAEFHFRNIERGVLDTRDLVYYASLIFLGLYFSALALKRRF
jgi:ABC-2 type transport system permease protein